MALLLHDVYAGDDTLHYDIIIFNFTWNYLIIIYIYYYHTDIMQISIYVINNMPEPGRNLAADACMERTQLLPCIYNFSTTTYITLLQQLWQTVLVWNLYPIFILLNQLAVKITLAESFLWMHLHQFQYLYVYIFHPIGFEGLAIMLVSVNMFNKLVLKSFISRDVSATGTGLNMLLSVIRFMFSYRIFYKGVPGFATDWPCGAGCRGLTTCLLYVCPLFGN